MKNTSEAKVFGKITQVFFFTVIGILAVLASIVTGLWVTDNTSWDAPNWVTLVVEIGVGMGIAGSILVYEKSQQKKFKEQQDKISELVSQVKTMTDNQESFRKGRHRWAIHQLMNELDNLKQKIVSKDFDKNMASLFGENANVSSFLYAKSVQDIIHDLELISNQAGDVIEPNYLFDLSQIINLTKQRFDENKWMIDDRNKDVVKLIEKLVERFEKIYPPV